MKTAFALYRYRMKATNDGLIRLILPDVYLSELFRYGGFGGTNYVPYYVQYATSTSLS